MNSSPRLWFKRKRYGWGWTPVTWEGWLTLLVYLVCVFGLTRFVHPEASTREVFSQFLLPLTGLTLILLRVCFQKGESPRWQWGEKKEERTK